MFYPGLGEEHVPLNSLLDIFSRVAQGLVCWVCSDNLRRVESESQPCTYFSQHPHRWATLNSSSLHS